MEILRLEPSPDCAAEPKTPLKQKSCGVQNGMFRGVIASDCS